MKFKRLLLASIFILAILMIGAASASENATDFDALNAADEVALESDDSSEVLADGSYYDNDFYIYVEENYTHGERDWNSYELIYMASYCERNSTIDVLVDDVEKQKINVTEGHFSVGYESGTPYYIYYRNIYPADLGLDYGAHNLKVNIDGKNCINTQISVNKMEDFTIWLQNPYYCEQDYWTSPSFLIIDSNNMNTGTLEVYVNGTRKLAYSVKNGCFDEIENCSNKSRYVAPADILPGYGTYNIQINLTENGTVKTLKDENVVVAEYEPTLNPRLEVYFDFYTLIIPADDIAHIYLPREATGNLTITYNNVINETVSYSKGYGWYYMNSWDLNHLGENLITVTYMGDDFGTLTATGTVLVLPDITCPSYVNVGEEFDLSILTHDWVGGILSVYDYTGDVQGQLLNSSEIYRHAGQKFATASVKLSSQKPGLNKLYLDYYDYYAGHYGIVQEVNVVQNSENVNVDVPKDVESGSSFNVTVNAPDYNFTFAQISVDGADSDFIMLENGVAIKNVSNLSDGYHTVRVFYENGYYVDGKYVGDIYLNTFTVNVGIRTNLTVTDVIVDFNSTGNMVITLKDANGTPLPGKTVKISLNGNEYINVTDNNGQTSLAIDIPAGNYSALVVFEGAEGYLSSNATADVTVNKINSILNVSDVEMGYGTSVNVTATTEGAIGVTAKIDDMEVIVNDNTIVIPVLDVGNYTLTVTTIPDANHNPVTKTANVTVNKLKTQFNASDVSVVAGTSNDLAIRLIDSKGNGLAGKEVIVCLEHTDVKTTDANGNVYVTGNLDEGDYKIFVSFNGDSYCEASRIDFMIHAYKLKSQIVSSNLTAVYGESASLKIVLTDSNGTGIAGRMLSVTVDNANYTETTDANGIASIPVSHDAGVYSAQISFNGDNTYLASDCVAQVSVAKASSKLSAPQISTTYNVAKNLVITLKDSNGQVLAGKTVIVTLKGKPSNKITDSNGQVKVSSYNLAPDKYTVKVRFDGDANYNQSGIDTKVVVAKATPKITASNKAYKVKTKTKKYTITLKNNKNAVLKNKKVTLKVNKKTYTAKTNSKGKATFKITKLTKKGTFKAVIKYAGDSCYKSVSKTTKITVKK